MPPNSKRFSEPFKGRTLGHGGVEPNLVSTNIPKNRRRADKRLFQLSRRSCIHYHAYLKSLLEKKMINLRVPTHNYNSNITSEWLAATFWTLFITTQLRLKAEGGRRKRVSRKKMIAKR